MPRETPGPLVNATNGRLFITLERYSPPSRAFEQSKACLRLKDGEELVDSVSQHYERFDSRYEDILPLEPVCVAPAGERRRGMKTDDQAR